MSRTSPATRESARRNGQALRELDQETEEDAGQSDQDANQASMNLEQLLASIAMVDKLRSALTPSAPADAEAEPVKKSGRKRPRLEDLDDDEGEDQQSWETRDAFIASQARKRRRERIHDWMGMFCLLLISQLAFNRSNVMWWLDANVKPHVDSFGVATYQETFDYWTAASDAQKQLQDDARELIAQLETDVSTDERRRLEEDLFDARDQIRTLEDNIQFRRRILDSYNEEHGQVGITAEFFLEKAPFSRGQIIALD